MAYRLLQAVYEFYKTYGVETIVGQSKNDTLYQMSLSEFMNFMRDAKLIDVGYVQASRPACPPIRFHRAPALIPYFSTVAPNTGQHTARGKESCSHSHWGRLKLT